MKVYRGAAGRARWSRGRGGDRGDPGRAAVARHALSRDVLLDRRRCATTCRTAGSCSTRAWSSAAVAAFERAAQATPTPSTLYRLGTLLTKSGETARARAAFERALALQPDLPRPATIWARSSPRAATWTAAIERFAPRSRRHPDYPDALEQSRLRVAAQRARRGSPRALREGARAAARFPRGDQQPRIALGRGGDLEPPSATSATRCRGAPTTARRPTIWRSCSSPRGRRTRPSSCSRDSSTRLPRSRAAYVTLAKIHSPPGGQRGRSPVLQRLLQRNPKNAAALEMLETVEKSLALAAYLSWRQLCRLAH